MMATSVASFSTAAAAAAVTFVPRCEEDTGELGRGTASCRTRVKSVSMRAIMNKDDEL
jgi:hypothetical protein